MIIDMQFMHQYTKLRVFKQLRYNEQTLPEIIFQVYLMTNSIELFCLVPYIDNIISKDQNVNMLDANL